MTRVERTGVVDAFGFPVLRKVGEPEPIVLPDESPDQIQAKYESAKFMLECASGGKNTILFDDIGCPSVMVKIPMFLWSDVLPGAPEEPCSAFVVGGKVLDYIYISKYMNVIEHGRAYSLPGRDPENTLTIDEARTACTAKGKGWHLLTNAEWCALAHWSIRNDTVPRGNAFFGADDRRPWEHGVLSNQQRGRGLTDEMRTLTGSGPDRWNHDAGPWGISDLNGNAWDWVSGFRTVDGEIQFIPDNDSALNVDESTESTLWRAVLADGTLVEPGTPGTLRYDGLLPGTDSPEDIGVRGGYCINDRLINKNYTGSEQDISHRAFGWSFFSDIAPASGISVPPILWQLGAVPAPVEYKDKSVFFLRNYGERICARGGSWLNNRFGGMWDLYLRESRAFIYPDIGFRSAYVDLED